MQAAVFHGLFVSDRSCCFSWTLPRTLVFMRLLKIFFLSFFYIIVNTYWFNPNLGGRNFSLETWKSNLSRQEKQNKIEEIRR